MPANKKPRKKYTPWKVTNGITNTPRIDEVVRTFQPLRDMLAELKKGTVDTIKGYPVMIDWQREYCRIDHALLGWIGGWERLAPTIDQSPLIKLHKALELGIPLTIDQIVNAERVIDKQQAIYLQTPVEHIKSAITTELINIEFENMGLTQK